jgi:hypothetical protein
LTNTVPPGVDAEDVDEPAPPGTLDEATGGTEVLDADAEVRIGDPTTVEDGSMTVELLGVYVEQGQIVVVEYTVLVTVRSLFWIFHSFAETPNPSPSKYAAVRRIFKGVNWHTEFESRCRDEALGGVDHSKIAEEEEHGYLHLPTDILHCISSRLHCCVFVDDGTCS